MVRQIANTGVLVAVLWVNAMAGSGALSGESIGLIANRYTSFFLPANYVFGIWSLIYLALVAFTLFQSLPAQRSSRAVRAVGWWWAVSGALNIAWVALFSFSLFAAATRRARPPGVRRSSSPGPSISTWPGSPWRSSPTPSSF